MKNPSSDLETTGQSEVKIQQVHRIIECFATLHQVGGMENYWNRFCGLIMSRVALRILKHHCTIPYTLFEKVVIRAQAVFIHVELEECRY